MIHKRQQEFIDYFKEELKTQQFITSAFLKGSIANGKSDEYSDIDLYCVTKKEKIEELKSFRNHIIHNFKNILYTENVNFKFDQIIVIFDNDLHLDFYIMDKPPTEGNTPIFILYDKKGELQKYILKDLKNNIDDAIQYYKDSVYSLHELLIALKRNDYLWSMRLISHMIAYLSLVLCYKYNPNNDILHIKNLYYALPKKEKEQIDEILALATPSNIPICILRLIDLQQYIQKILLSGINDELEFKYLEYVINKIKNEPLFKEHIPSVG